jgi:hypothetical protein
MFPNLLPFVDWNNQNQRRLSGLIAQLNAPLHSLSLAFGAIFEYWSNAA